MPGRVAAGYIPLRSGLVEGSGGIRKRKARRNVIRGGKLRHFPDIHLGDRVSLREVIPDFDPALEHEYSSRELIILAEKMLDSDPKPPHVDPVIVTPWKIGDISRREIYCSVGVPEPHIVKGIYWRTHPNGRKVNSDDQRRRNGASYYR